MAPILPPEDETFPMVRGPSFDLGLPTVGFSPGVGIFEEDGVGPLPIEPPLSSFPICLDIFAIPHICKPAMRPCPSMANTVPKPPPVIPSHIED